MGKAEYLKARTIEWLLKGNLCFDRKSDCVGSEVLFSPKRRKADLLVFSKHAHTLEIKSRYDNIQKLSHQLKDYHKTFDKVSVITTPKHLKLIKKLLLPKTGLILFDNEQFKILKQASPNKLSKFDLLMFLNKQQLLHLYRPKNYARLSTDQIRLRTSKEISLKKIREISYKTLKLRYENSFSSFLRNINGTILWDEIRGLSGKVGKIRC